MSTEWIVAIQGTAIVILAIAQVLHMLVHHKGEEEP
jgi:hypothetical protein